MPPCFRGSPWRAVPSVVIPVPVPTHAGASRMPGIAPSLLRVQPRSIRSAAGRLPAFFRRVAGWQRLRARAALERLCLARRWTPRQVVRTRFNEPVHPRWEEDFLRRTDSAIARIEQGDARGPGADGFPIGGTLGDRRGVAGQSGDHERARRTRSSREKRCWGWTACATGIRRRPGSMKPFPAFVVRGRCRCQRRDRTAGAPAAGRGPVRVTTPGRPRRRPGPPSRPAARRPASAGAAGRRRRRRA